MKKLYQIPTANISTENCCKACSPLQCNMKAILLCTFLICAVWAAPEVQKPQHKRLYVDPINGTLPKNIVPRITNGREAEPHSIPYQAYLIVTLENGSGLICSGSLISPRHILTAANCLIDGVEARVVLGAHNIDEDEESQVVVRSRNLIPHRYYDENTVSNDIAIIELEEPVELSPAIDTVRLPRREDHDDITGEIARVSGWGRISGDGQLSPVLMEAETTIISNEDCGRVFNIVIDSQVCTLGIGGTCSGDSGGPLVIDDVLVGVVSYGAVGCPDNFPSAYTRVTSFLDWIEDVTDLDF